MSNNVNCKSFIPEEVEQGLHLDLIKYLLDYNSKSKEYYYDIRITTDGYCTTVEWADASFTKDIYLGEFKFIDEEHEVVKEVIFPDNHIEYLPDEWEKDALESWLEENPGWEKDDYGHWYRSDECVEMSDLFSKHMADKLKEVNNND